MTAFDSTTLISAATPPGSPAPQPGNSGGLSVVALGYWTIAALVLAGGAMSAILLSTNHPEWWRGFAAATLVGAVSTVIALLPVVVAARGSVRTLAFGYLVGMLLRMMSVLSLLLVAVMVFNTPRVPTAIFTLAYALAGLTAEVLVLVRAMSNMNSAASKSNPSATKPEGKR